MKKLNKQNVENILTLTPMQKGMLFHSLKEPESNVYHEQLDLDLFGHLDREVFEYALNTVIETNEMLRTLFWWEKIENPVQVILKEHKQKIDFCDVSELEIDRKGAALEDIRERDRKFTFDLTTVPFRVTVCRYEIDRYRLIISNHHILYDGWSNGIILKELFDAYHEKEAGRGYVKPVKARFYEYVKQIEDRDRERSERYWSDYLEGFETPALLPDKKKGRGAEKKMATIRRGVEKKLSAELESRTRALKITLASVIYSAWGLLRQKYNNTRDEVFGTTVSGRNAAVKGIEEIVGLFINTVPLRLKRKGGETVADILQRVDRDLRDRKEYETDTLVDVKTWARREGNEELFDTLVVLENYPLDARLKDNRQDTPSGLKIMSYRVEEAAHYDLTLIVTAVDGNMEIGITYNTAVYETETVEAQARRFHNLMEVIAAGPEVNAADIDILSEEEKDEIINKFNATAAGYPPDKTIHRLFEEQAAQAPDAVAVSGIETAAHITGGVLNRQADRLAQRLRKKGVGAESIVAIKKHRSVEQLVGILAILKAGGAYLPIDPDYPEQRVDYIMKDSNAAFQLGQAELSGLLDRGNGEMRPPESVREPLGPSESAAALAYIMYTSGSTGRPKGVMVEHRGVVRLVKNTDYIQFSEKDRILPTGAQTFDASTFETWGALLNGLQQHQVEQQVILNPPELKKIIRRHDIAILWMTSALFNRMVDADIHIFETINTLLVGGDVLSPEHVNRVSRTYPHINIVNGYGPTENTTFSTTYRIPPGRAGETGTIPIGKPIANSTAYIVDTDGNLAPIGNNGELVVGGDGVARGYLNNPELTAERFVTPKFPLPGGEAASERRARTTVYRTGDLARRRPDGNIEFMGRIDQQLKIRGYRIEPGEIEMQLRSHGAVKDVVVIAAEPAEKLGEKYLCAYVVADTQSTMEELREYISGKMPDYMIPAHIVAVDKIPLTPHGKVDRKALPKTGTPQTKKYAPPRNAREKKLVEIWGSVLGISKEDHDTIGIDHDFFRLGGHSLKVTGLTGRIHKEYDIEIPVGELFKNPTIRWISNYIDKAERLKYEPVPVAEEKDYFPLTITQKRFYVFQELRPGDTSYNMTEVMQLEGELSREKIEDAFRRLMARHDGLRATFHKVEGEPVQRFQRGVGFKVRYYGKEEVKRRGRKEIIGDFVQPFDLSKPPLWRVALVEESLNRHYLVFDMHHLIGDGVSVGIIIRDFQAIYGDRELPPLRVGYRDYLEWQQRRREEKRAAQRTADRPEELEDRLLNLPTDKPRPAIPTFEGRLIRRNLTDREVAALYRLCGDSDATLYMVLQAMFNILLAKLSGQEIIAVGTPIAGRGHVDLDNMVGLILQTICLRNRVTEEKRYTDLLKEVKARAVHAYENQDYQYGDLVEKAEKARNTGRNPLFDVMLVLQNMEMPEIRLPGLTVSRDVGESLTSKFDLSLYCEEKETLFFKWEYSTALFKEETIRRFIRYYENLQRQILADPDRTIGELDIIPEEERQQILYEFNDSARPYPRWKTVYRLIEEQADRTPENDAVISRAGRTGEPAVLTFRRLNRRANRLARLLREKGTGVGTVVGLMMERTEELVTALLAVQKAGGVYVPIDPKLPENRITRMVEASGAALLVTHSHIAAEKAPVTTGTGTLVEMLPLDEMEAILEMQPGDNPEHISGPGDQVYIIFTSGSTGNPKGAGVYHGGETNLLHWFVTEFGFTAGDRLQVLTSPSFDLTQKSIYAPLISGGTLCIPEKEYFDPGALRRQVRDDRVTLVSCTPSMFYKMVENETTGREKMLTTLRYVFLGGEPVSIKYLQEWLESEECGAQVVNTYGPTECTDISGYYRIGEPRRYLNETVPIGKPVYNQKLYVTDKKLRLQPIGVVGELLIGGPGVGSGYVNDPEQTERKFIRHTFEEGREAQLLYRTGDLAKWRADGNVEYQGRIDHQVKIRGYRIETGEIESQLLSQEAVKEAVVIPQESEQGERYLCAYIVPSQQEGFSEKDVREAVSKELPDYMVPSFIEELEALPLNPNGKVDRKALPAPARAAGGDRKPPQNEVEVTLVRIWSDELGLPKGALGVGDNFFVLGGHSLKAAGLVNRIYREFSIEIPLAKIFKSPTIRDMADYILESRVSRYRPPEPVEEKEYYPVSPAQKRMYTLQQVARESAAYNITARYEITGQVDKEKLQDVFRSLIRRHESFRTAFFMKDEQVYQQVSGQVDFEVETIEIERGEPGNDIGACDGNRAEEEIQRFIRPFDLAAAPQLRVGLVKMTEDRSILVVDMHHIISDGRSCNILIEEFTAQYAGRKLPAVKIRYRDFAHRQSDAGSERERRERQEEYWINQFSGENPRLDIPTDNRRQEVQDFEGRTVRFELEPGETSALKDMARQEGTTVFILMLAIYNVFLGKISGSETVVVGTPVLGRSHPDQERVIGMFVNTVALKNNPAGGKTFREFLGEVGANTLEAFENQDYPFDRLVDRVEKGRDLSRNPIFDVMLTLANMENPPLEIPGLTITPYEVETNIAKFDINFIIHEPAEGGLEFACEYRTALFEGETIERFIGYIRDITADVLRDKTVRLEDIAVVDTMLEAQTVEIEKDFNF